MNHQHTRIIMAPRILLALLAGPLLAISATYGQTPSNGCSFAGAQQFPVNTSCVTSTFNLSGGWGTDLSPALCGGAVVQDDGFGWFTAIAASTTVTYTANNAGHNPTIHIYAGSACGSLGAPTCYNTSATSTETATFATSVGQSYLIRIQRNASNNAMDGTICIHSTLANDDPCSATALTVGASCSSVTYSNSGATTTSGPPAPGCGTFGAGSKDVWYTFVAPATGHVNVSTTAGTMTDAAMAVYSATACAGTFTLISCNDNANGGNMPAIDLTGLTPSTTYYVRLWGTGTTSGTYAICAYDMPGDAPCTATALTVNSSCTSIASTNVGASQSGVATPSCGTFNTGSDDVWFTFVAPASGVTSLSTSAGTLTDGVMAVYSAPSCNGTMTQVACNNNGTGMPLLNLSGLTAGATYYVRFWGNGSLSGTFNICAFDASPANDNPCGAVSLPVNTSCVNTSGTNAFATATSGIPAPGCGSAPTTDVWYTFTAPATGAVNISTTAGTLTDAVMALYAATTCSSGFSVIACNDDFGGGYMPYLQVTGLTPGTTYYVRIWGYSGGTGTFSLCATSFTPVAGDDPCTANALTLSTSCTGTTYSNTGATISTGIPTPGCGGLSGGDIWFSFTAPTSGFASFRTTAGTLANTAMALYRATACNGTLTLVDCDDNNGAGTASFLTFSDLIPGNTYYLRVWGEGATFGDFSICGYAPPTGTSCFYALNMFDEIGDGWGGSTVGIRINGGAWTNHTIATGERDVVYIGVNTGQAFELQYTAAGGAQTEISYNLQSGPGALYSAGPTPTAGIVYTATVDCDPAQASDSDCIGGRTICNAQDVNGSPTNTGLVADLNIQTRGCLSSNERQGMWYNFQIATGGTVAFTIAPDNTGDDYDFAVWGPFAAFDCRSKSAPLRCSYSGLSGNTGLQVGAGDDSEDDLGNKWVNAINVNAGEVYLLYISNYSQSGLAFNLTWQLSNGATLDCLVLPIELGGFEAQPIDQQVKLDWWTASETNNDLFVIERSADAMTFEAIGTVDGAGNSTSAIGYDWVDEDPLSGTSYYRLRQIDLDGLFSFSEIRSVHFHGTAHTTTAFPNPATDLITLQVEAGRDAACDIEVIDAQGRVVQRMRTALREGPNQVELRLDDVAEGHYIARLVGPFQNGVSTVRFTRRTP
ncbi:MAG: T9SS type A sorting domain-containing protein [Flavobacteriales bacterium]|nr:T9SS type A sorting domain-containing protein [Flavobacteriales bacterium]